MAKTPTGETGKTIQLKRTALTYNDNRVINEQLEYGEPLYNDNDKTLLIGDGTGTANNSLKVIKAVDRLKANNQAYFSNESGTTLNPDSNISNLYNENNVQAYVKDKDWTPNGLLIENTDTYNFTVNSNNEIVIGTKQSTAFSSLPCVQQYTVSGMSKNYVPTVSLYLVASDAPSVANTKAKQKAFGCVSRVDTDTNKIILVFFKKPTSQFRISIVGG